MAYVDGFLVPLPKRSVAAYRRMSLRASRIWMEYGALDYRECVGDDLKVKGMASFPHTVRARAGETVVFSWITYRSRAQRDRVNKLIMKDPRLAAMMEGKAMPFDVRRMRYGGFRVIVSAEAGSRRGRSRR